MQPQAGGISKQADISRQPKQTNSEWRTGTEQPFLCSAQHIKRYVSGDYCAGVKSVQCVLLSFQRYLSMKVITKIWLITK
jgi:hypothetical protein